MGDRPVRLLVAVFPANVQMAAKICSGSESRPAGAIAWARLPLQLPLIRWALKAAPARGGGVSLWITW